MSASQGGLDDPEWWKEWFSFLQGIGDELGGEESHFEGGGLWSVSKLAYVGAYAREVFGPVGGSNFDNLYYIDLLAGDGLTTVQSPTGETQTVAGSAIAIPAAADFDTVFVNDRDPDKIEALEARVEALKEELNLPEYKFFNGDANEVATEIVGDLWNRWRDHEESFLTMTFVDNQGLDVNFETIEKLVEVKNDLHILFPSIHGFWQNAKNSRDTPEQFPGITEFFGSERWIEADDPGEGAEIYLQEVNTAGQDSRVGGPLPKIEGKKSHHYHMVSSVEETSGGSEFLKGLDSIAERVDELAWETQTTYHDVAEHGQQFFGQHGSEEDGDSQTQLSDF